MSAYVCAPEHFAALAAFASAGRDSHVISEYKDVDPIVTARRVAVELARENIRSVNHRYHSAALPGPGIDRLLQETADLAEKYFFHTGKLGPVDILKMCQGLDYQRSTLACRQLDWITSAAIRMLPGYEAAPWEYDGSRHDLSGPAPVLLSRLIKR